MKEDAFTAKQMVEERKRERERGRKKNRGKEEREREREGEIKKEERKKHGTGKVTTSRFNDQTLALTPSSLASVPALFFPLLFFFLLFFPNKHRAVSTPARLEAASWREAKIARAFTHRYYTALLPAIDTNYYNERRDTVEITITSKNRTSFPRVTFFLVFVLLKTRRFL